MAISIIGLLFTIVGVFYSYLVKERKRISFVVRTHKFMSEDLSNHDRLSLSFDGKKIDMLYLTTIRFWNSGNTQISKDDIVNDKIKILLENDSLLHSKISAFVNKNNEINIDDDSITFDFLKVNEGARITVLHTKEKIDVQDDKCFKTGKFVIDNNINWASKRIRFKKNFYLITRLLYSVFCICFLGLAIYSFPKEEGPKESLVVNSTYYLNDTTTTCTTYDYSKDTQIDSLDIKDGAIKFILQERISNLNVQYKNSLFVFVSSILMFILVLGTIIIQEYERRKLRYPKELR